MKSRPLLMESVFVTGFAVLGLLLRTWHLNHEAVEHFDEGIYASVLWHDATLGTPSPAREFYAPPLLSGLIELVSCVRGLARIAPFLPAILLGSLTTLAMWWLGRAWFGRAAGIFLSALVAMSDFHIIYSRMALTDVPCLLWIVVSVYLGTLAVQRQSFRTAVAAGFVCGLAWWTKYTGWLPLAIVISGTILWWIWLGRKSFGLIRTSAILLTMTSSAAVSFSPWWWQLQEVGGYAAVSANHMGYLHGWSDWTDRQATHWTIQLGQDGISGRLSLALGLIAAGVYRFRAAESSTGNRADRQSGSSFPPLRLLVRFLVASLALTVLAVRIKTPLMLTCIALGGFGGMYLWPVLRRSWVRREVGDLSPFSEHSLRLSPGDLESAPTIDPALGLCTTLTWFAGMLIVTPLYHPYSRLFFPLLASIWLAAAGGVSWWLESNISVARRETTNPAGSARGSWGQHLVTSMLVAATVSSFLKFDENKEIDHVSMQEITASSLGMDRTSIVDAAAAIADLAVRSARGEISTPHEPLPERGRTIRPDDVAQAAMAEQQAVPIRLTPENRKRERLIMYAFGEPALLFHLNQAGIAAFPVSHLSLRGPDETPPTVPTFIVIGPHAKRTSGFWEQWMSRTKHFEFVADVPYLSGQVTLLDLFTPGWLEQHPESEVQKLELHRVR